MPDRPSAAEVLVGFRAELYNCLFGWADALFELCDALLCAPGPVTSVPALSLEPVFRRSHGSLYKALANAGIETEWLRRALVAHRPRAWPLVFAVDASTWARCDAECSPERGFHYSASRHSAGQPIVAGWAYQWVSQLGWAPDSWTAPLDTLRLKPSMDPTTATIDQLKGLLGLLPADGDVPPVRLRRRLRPDRHWCRAGRGPCPGARAHPLGPGVLPRPLPAGSRHHRASPPPREAVRVVGARHLGHARFRALQP